MPTQSSDTKTAPLKAITQPLPAVGRTRAIPVLPPPPAASPAPPHGDPYAGPYGGPDPRFAPWTPQAPAPLLPPHLAGPHQAVPAAPRPPFAGPPAAGPWQPEPPAPWGETWLDEEPAASTSGWARAGIGLLLAATLGAVGLVGYDAYVQHRAVPDAVTVQAPQPDPQPAPQPVQPQPNPSPTPQGASLGTVAQDRMVTVDGQERGGAFLVSVQPGSPAAQCGLRPGDTIVALDQSPVTSAASLDELLATRTGGDSATVTYVRNNETQDVQATLAARA